MREILFRGKTADNGEWVEGFYYVRKAKYAGDRRFISEVPMITTGIVQSRGAYGESQEIIEYEVIPETVGQYTGFKDKDGTEIFEGDIVIWTGIEDWEEVGEVSLISYDEELAQFIQTIEGLHPSEILSPEKLMVIGNIYENPELLKGAK